MKWNFQKWLHNRESRDIFFCAILVVIPFYSDSVAKIYFFWNPYQEVKTKSHWERITILFSSQSMKIFQCKSKSRLFLPLFFSHGIGAHILSKSRPSSCVLFQPWYKGIRGWWKNGQWYLHACAYARAAFLCIE